MPQEKPSEDHGCRCPRTHHYAALTVGDQTLQNPDGRPLTSWQMLAFLTEQRRDVHLVGFFFNYDATFILRDLPPEKVRQIIKGDQR